MMAVMTKTTIDAEVGFAAWARNISQRTNRSLAGCRLIVPANQQDDHNHAASSALRQFSHAAAQWGMVVQPDDAEKKTSYNAPEYTVHFNDTVDTMFDSRNASGYEAMAYAQAHMPVTARLIEELAHTVGFTGVRIAVCLILEPKTAVLLRLLKAAGAIVGVCCESESTDQRVADQLAGEGIIVEANASWSAQQSYQGALRLLDTIRPQIIIDDGASFARLAAMERPQLFENLIGVAEETTSGVRAFQAMQDAGALTFPVIAVNDSMMKTGFDNAHGTGETCVTTMQRILGDDAFHDAHVAIIGYGPVGRGFAIRIRALGAHVTVCDIDPVAALSAVFDGFAARDIDEVLTDADMVVSATGVRHTITLDHMRHMHDGAVLSVIGGIANEIALDDIPGFEAGVGHDALQLTVPDGPTLTLLADGDGVNYTVGGGNPIEIMDLSFAVQVSAVAYLLRTRGTLEQGIHRLDRQADQHIASIALEVRGFHASHDVTDNGYDWTMTRFVEDTRGNTTGEGENQ